MSQSPDEMNPGHEPFDLETLPLDPPPQAGMTDWGGDGSDLSRPVRAHVLAALVPTEEPYPPPVDALLQIGQRTEEDAVDTIDAIAALNLGQEHLHDLVRMARDRALYTAMSDTPDVWAPDYAMEALRDLDISSVVEDLIPLFDVDADWINEQLMTMIAPVGEPALEPLVRYIADTTRWWLARSRAMEALEWLVERYPEHRTQVVAVFSDVLHDHERNDETINSSVISSLMALQAEEALPLIRAAFEHGNVDEMVHGDWAEVLHEMGHEPEPDDPLVAISAQRREARYAQMLGPRPGLGLAGGGAFGLPGGPLPSAPAPKKKASDQQRKAKQKRKQSEASRKANQSKGKKKKKR